MELCWIILFRNITDRKLSLFLFKNLWTENPQVKDHFKLDLFPAASVRPLVHGWSNLDRPENRIFIKLLKVFTLYPLVECHFKYDLIRSGIDFCINSDQYSMGTFPFWPASPDGKGPEKPG